MGSDTNSFLQLFTCGALEWVPDFQVVSICIICMKCHLSSFIKPVEKTAGHAHTNKCIHMRMKDFLSTIKNISAATVVYSKLKWLCGWPYDRSLGLMSEIDPHCSLILI